jgi:recombination protein RecT
MSEQPKSATQRCNELMAVLRNGPAMEMVFGREPDPAVVKRYHDAFLQHLRRTPDLLNCSTNSIVEALQSCVTTGLIPGGVLGECYIIPRAGEASFQVGYLGLIKLCGEAPKIRGVNAELVYSNDKFRGASGSNPNIRHVYATGDRGTVIGCYAVVWLRSGICIPRWMTTDQIEKWKQRYVPAKAQKEAWKTAWEAMYRKTVLTQAVKFAPLRAEVRQILQQAEYDEAGVDDDRLRSGDTIKAESSRPLVAAIGADTAGVTLPAEFGADPEPDTRSASRRASDELFGDGAPSPEEAPELYAQ